MTVQRKNGFTLAEVLVILAILAVLTAVLVPTVTNQIRKGDINRVATDLGSLRTGTEAFLSDVRRYPLRVAQLTKTLGAADSDVLRQVIPSGLRSNWKGPYINRDTTTNTTGFGATLVTRFDTITNTTNGVKYMLVRVNDIAQSDFNDVDQAIDGAISSTGGLLRWVSGGVSGVDTLKYFMLPIN